MATITFAIVTRATVPVPVVILPFMILPRMIPPAWVPLIIDEVICFAAVRIVVMAAFRGIWPVPGRGKGPGLGFQLQRGSRDGR